MAAGEYIFTAQLPADQTYLWIREITLTKTGEADHAAVPTASPVAGRYTSTQNVVLTSATADADIYYTTDGNDPTTSSPKYTGPITVDRSMTIKAFAVKAGRTDSAIESFAYEIATPTPVITPMNGVRFYQNLKVSIATVSGATVHYTLDGTDPSESSPTYTAPIDLTESKTVKAVAYRDGFAASEIASVDYIKADGDAPTTLDYDFTVINQKRRTGVKANPFMNLATDYATVDGFVDEINAREPGSAATQPWCYGGKDDGTGLFYNDDTGCRIGIGNAATGAGMWGGYRIYIPADGTYDITVKHFRSEDSKLCGDVEFYLAPVTADNQIDSKYLLSGVNTLGDKLLGKETLVKEGMELTAGEYYFTGKLVNSPYLWVEGVSFTREAVVTPATEIDFVALAKDHHVVGDGYTVTANDDGLTITLTEKITPSNTTRAVTCDNAEIVAAVGAVEYPTELNADADDPNGEKRYVAIPVKTAFDIDNNPYFTADIVAGASNSADAGWSFGIWYEGDKASGSHKNSARYTGNFFDGGTANGIAYEGIGKSSQVNGSWFSHDSLKYSDKGFSAYLADRSGNFKVNAAIFKVVGDVGDTFTFKTVKFETNKTEFSTPVEHVYNFMARYQIFQNGDYNTGDYHNPAVPATDLTYDKVAEIGATFNAFMAGHPGYSNYKTTLPAMTDAWAVLDLTPNSFTANNKDVGLWNVTKNSYISIGIKLTASGNYDMSSWMRF